MAIVRNKLMVELYPTVQDVCEVISAAGAFFKGQEEQYLEAIKVSIENRLEQIREVKQNG